MPVPPSDSNTQWERPGQMPQPALRGIDPLHGFLGKRALTTKLRTFNHQGQPPRWLIWINHEVKDNLPPAEKENRGYGTAAEHQVIPPRSEVPT